MLRRRNDCHKKNSEGGTEYDTAHRCVTLGTGTGPQDYIKKEKEGEYTGVLLVSPRNGCKSVAHMIELVRSKSDGIDDRSSSPGMIG